MTTSTHRRSVLTRTGVALALWMVATIANAQANDPLSPLDKADGQTVFQHICQGCHMPDAKGATGAGTYPALAGDPRLVSAAYMAATLLNGRRNMPAFAMAPGQNGFFETKLSDAQIAEVINYVRTHFGNHYTDTITAEQVAAMHRP